MMDVIEGVEYLMASSISMAAMPPCLFPHQKWQIEQKTDSSIHSILSYMVYIYIYILIHKFLYIDYLLILVFKTMFQNHNPFRDTKND